MSCIYICPNILNIPTYHIFWGIAQAIWTILNIYIIFSDIFYYIYIKKCINNKIYLLTLLSYKGPIFDCFSINISFSPPLVVTVCTLKPILTDRPSFSMSLMKSWPSLKNIWLSCKQPASGEAWRSGQYCQEWNILRERFCLCSLGFLHTAYPILLLGHGMSLVAFGICWLKTNGVHEWIFMSWVHACNEKTKQGSWWRTFGGCQNVIYILYRCVNSQYFCTVIQTKSFSSWVALFFLCPVFAAPFLGLSCYVAPLLKTSALELKGRQKEPLVGWLVGRMEVVPAVCQKQAW